MKDKRQTRRAGMPTFLLVVMALVAVASCKKKSSDKTAEKVDFKFSNNVPEPLHIDIYDTRASYYGNISPIASADLSLNGEHTFTGLTSGQEYYIDWYSPDYYYNNWYNGQGIPSLYIGFTPTAANNYAQLNHLFEIDFSRRVLINGNKALSGWHAISAYKGAVYFWDSLDDGSKARSLSFNKNFSGVYNNLSNGKLYSEPFSFVPDSRNSTLPDFTTVMTSSAGHGSVGTVRSITTGTQAAVDSIRVTFTSSPELYYIFLRD